MRWSDYVIFMACLTLMLYVGGYSSIADPLNTNSTFIPWLTNLAGSQSVSADMYGMQDTSSNINPINVTDLATGKTNTPGTQNGLLGSFGIDIATVLTGNVFVFLVGFATVAIVLGYLGFSANFILPLFMLMAMVSMNLFFFPLGFLLNDMTMPTILKVFIPVIFNTLFVLAVMDFMRGGA